MKKTNRHREKKAVGRNTFKMFLLIFISLSAILFGRFTGNIIYNSDSNFVASINIETLKKALNNSIPAIDTVYNSGNTSSSFTSEMKNFITGIFNFDLSNPLTVLNAQSPVLYSYYNNTYMPGLAQKNTQKDDIQTAENLPIPEDDSKELESDASSISTEESSNDSQISEGGVVASGKITIQNETNAKVNIDELLKEPLKFNFDKKNSKVLIYHTHTTESYLPNLKDLKSKNIPVSNTNPMYNVVRVGDELAQNLEKSDFSVLHNGTVHDYDYNNSYGASLNTLSQYMKSYPTMKMTFDIHRDGLDPDKQKLRTAKTINGKSAAQIMFVIGTNSRYPHPNWKENLKLAVKLQQRLNEICPGLAKPIYISKNRYNEHITTGSLIIEVGADGDLLSECLESTKYLAKAINDVVSAK